jgi:glycosyltransferase involved in cell wall biosynthesis
MLGWEFPPLITGGLGKASYGIAKGLSPYVDLTVVIPRSHSENFSEHWRTIGLNDNIMNMYSTESAANESLQWHYVDAELDPYTVEKLTSTLPQIDLEALLEQLTGKPQASPPAMTNHQAAPFLEDSNSYGPHLVDKITTYTEQVLQLSQNLTFDVVHAHDWMTYPAALQIKHLTQKPVVLHVHSLETDRNGKDLVPEENLAFRIEQKALQEADAVITVSEYTKEQVALQYRVLALHSAAVHNAPEPVESYWSPKGIQSKLVVWIGRVTQQKGTEYLLDTVEKLSKSDPNFKLVVAGTGDQLPHLIQETARRRLSKYILFTGFLDETKVRRLLSQADVFFMPSTSEPFGLAALEAVQFRVPCLISRQSGVSEVLKSALKADHWDTNRLSNYLYALLHYESLRKEIIEKCSLEMSHLSWNDSARQVLEMYEQVTGS